eukprot:7095717-Prymnesium_polylepis.1
MGCWLAGAPPRRRVVGGRGCSGNAAKCEVPRDYPYTYAVDPPWTRMVGGFAPPICLLAFRPFAIGRRSSPRDLPRN